MAITLVGSLTYSAPGVASGSITVNYSSLRDENGLQPTLQQGDYVRIGQQVGVAGNRDGAPTPPTGFTEIAGTQGGTNGLFSDGTSFDSNLYVWTAFLGSLPPASVDVPNSGNAADAVAGEIKVFRGVDQTTPQDVTPVPAQGTATSNPNPAAITPATAGAWIDVVGGGALGTGIVYSQPSDLSSVTNYWNTITQADTNDAVIGAGLKTDWTSGAFDPAAWTGGGVTAGNSWTAATMALRPASGGTNGNASAAGVTTTATAPAATGTGNATGSPAGVTDAASAPAATAQGAASAAASGVTTTASAPAAAASGNAAASAAGVTDTVTAPTATASAGVNGNATAAGATTTATAPSATATGTAAASAAGVTDTASAANASASGAAQALAAGVTAIASAPAASASAGANGNATASGVTVAATAAQAAAAGGANATAAGRTLTATAPSAAGTGTAAASAGGVVVTATPPIAAGITVAPSAVASRTFYGFPRERSFSVSRSRTFADKYATRRSFNGR